MNPSERVQRILDLLDNATQSPGDVAYEYDEADTCWRCSRPVPTPHGHGLCPRCFEWMRGDETLPTPRTPETVRAERDARRERVRLLGYSDEQIREAIAVLRQLTDRYVAPWQARVVLGAIPDAFASLTVDWAPCPLPPGLTWPLDAAPLRLDVTES